jgi:hypothetical protein
VPTVGRSRRRSWRSQRFISCVAISWIGWRGPGVEPRGLPELVVERLGDSDAGTLLR